METHSERTPCAMSPQATRLAFPLIRVETA